MEILGVDIGGSGIKGAIVDTETGEIKKSEKAAPADNAEEAPSY